MRVARIKKPKQKDTKRSKALILCDLLLQTTPLHINLICCYYIKTQMRWSMTPSALYLARFFYFPLWKNVGSWCHMCPHVQQTQRGSLQQFTTILLFLQARNCSELLSVTKTRRNRWPHSVTVKKKRRIAACFSSAGGTILTTFWLLFLHNEAVSQQRPSERRRAQSSVSRLRSTQPPTVPEWNLSEMLETRMTLKVHCLKAAEGGELHRFHSPHLIPNLRPTCPQLSCIDDD